MAAPAAMWRTLVIAAALIVALLLLLLAPPIAHALPLYARQTGQQCAACHNGFPELTPYGRLFKLNGYTFTGGQSIVRCVCEPGARRRDHADDLEEPDGTAGLGRRRLPRDPVAAMNAPAPLRDDGPQTCL
jgi:hypothetical protein